DLYNLREAVSQAAGTYLATLAKGNAILENRLRFLQETAAQVQAFRYKDMAFRIFRNDALQKYRAQFDLAARYVYLAAKAYDYETCLLGTDTRGGEGFLTDIIRQRSLGQVIGGVAVSRSVGLTDPLAPLDPHLAVLKGQLGFLTPEPETGRFSIRSELFRIKTDTNAASAARWSEALNARKVPDLWAVPEFRKFCNPFAAESAGPQPGLVIEFSTTVTSGLNYFGHALGGGDSFYDSSRFATKIRSSGVWFSGYNSNGLSTTPRVYLVPVGDDVMRAPTGPFDDAIRSFSVVDQKLPVPFPVGNAANLGAGWIPANDTLSEDFGGIRHFSRFRAYHDAGSF